MGLALRLEEFRVHDDHLQASIVRRGFWGRLQCGYIKEP